MRPTTSPSRPQPSRGRSSRQAPIRLTGAALILGGIAGVTGVLDRLPGRGRAESRVAPLEELDRPRAVGQG